MISDDGGGAAILDAAAVAAAIVSPVDRGFAVIHVTPDLKSLLGTRYREILDQMWTDRAISHAITAAISSGDPAVLSLPDSHRRIAVTARRSKPDGSRLVFTFTAPKDDGEQRDLRTTVDQLWDLVDNSSALMYIKDLHGRYLIVNECFARWFSIGAADVVGKTDHDLFPGTSAEVYSANDRHVLATGDSVEVEEPFSPVGGVTDPDDDHRWLSLKFPLLDADGQVYAVGAITTDITDRKRAESQATRARHEAERANRSKSEFLSRMSHELRTPLNAIIGFAQLLADRPVDPTVRESAEHILDAGRHLLTLVNDVLDISWIEAGAPGMTATAIPASEPIHRALRLIRPLARSQDIQLASDLHGAMHRHVCADGNRLTQVFTNLLGNAVKFNQTGGAIRVWCDAEDGALTFHIMDTGPGIAASDTDRLFTPFVRLRGAAEIEGSGLGLALSRRLVEDIGGELGIEHTAPGEGSTFFVRLPLAEPPEAVTIGLGEPPDASDDGLGHGATILYIEDTYANVALVDQIIADMGELRLTSAATGANGIELAKRLRPNLILLDLNLTDMSGVDVVRELCADPLTAGIPIIVVSADATPSRFAELRDTGVADYLTKPLDIRHFQRTVRRAMTPA